MGWSSFIIVLLSPYSQIYISPTVQVVMVSLLYF